MPYNINEEKSDIQFIVEGNEVYLKISKLPNGSGGSSPYIIKVGDASTPSDTNILSSLRVLKEISDRAISKTDADTASEIITFLKGLKIGGKSLSDIILSTDNISDTDIKDSSILSALKAAGMFLRKDKEDSTEFLLKLLGGIVTTFLKSENFESGQLGNGFGIYKKADGKSYMEVDELLVRVKAIFSELEIRKLSYVGGNIIFSSAGSKIVRVEETSDTYRCYFLADDGTTATTNGFAVGDQARCQTFNIKAGKYTGVANKYYWRLVTAVGDDYIELSKTDCDGTDIPAAGDSIVQMGNRTDSARQNLIEIVVTGDDAPAFIEYAGVNAYSLEGKRKTVLSPKGDEFVAKSFKIQTEDGSVTDLTQHTGYRIEKFTSPMYEFYTEGQTTYKATLSIRIFYNEKDITDTLPSTRFVWSRVSENTAGDPTWNELHESSASSIDITYQDLAGDTAFICQFLDNDKTVISTTNF